MLWLMEKWLHHKKSKKSPPSDATIKNNWCKDVPPRMCHRHEHKKSLTFTFIGCVHVNTQHISLCNGLTKDQGPFCDTTQSNFVGQIKGGSSEASRCQSNNRMFCIHMYSLLQSPVTRNSHFQSQMYQILQTWNHPEDLHVEEDCYEVDHDWEEEYKL